jgi:hypothetical protein
LEPEKGRLFENHGRLRFMAAGGENDGRAEDECSPEPGVRAEVFAEQLYAEVRAECGLDVEKDTGAGSGDMVNAPVPEKRCGGSAGEAANGEGDPCVDADTGKWRRLGSIRQPGIE